MDEKEKLISEYTDIIEFCQYAGLSEYEDKLKRKLEDLIAPLKIMIVGEGKSGKSTLLNALVGSDIAQVDDEPKTWCINLYSNTDGEPYAELVYSNEVVRTTIEQANEISERISSCDGIDMLSAEDRDLQEIRWYTNLEWPEKEIFIIDTPGFNQVRKDTSVETISIDGVDGVKFSAKENFDKYYYKADLVLWCFEATSVGDKEVEEHLKAVYKQGKRIYGIITKLDREEDPNERERLFIQNDNRYKKYNLVTSIRSGLPTIYEDDEAEEIENKKSIRRESIESIRKCIDYLLNDNKEADAIKIENSQKYLDEIKGKIGAIEKELLEFYYDNLRISQKVLEKFNSEIEKCTNEPKKNIEIAAESALVQMKSPLHLQELWLVSGNDINLFAEKLSEEFKNSEFITKCDTEWNKYISNIDYVVDHNLEQMKWKSVVLSIDNPEQQSEEIENDSVRPNDINWDFELKSFDIDIEKVGFLYQIMQLFEKESTIYQVINILAGDIIRDKVITITSDTITENINQISQKFCKNVSDALKNIKQSIEEVIDNSLKNHTGYNGTEIVERIIELERHVIKRKLLKAAQIEYFPIVNDERLEFEGTLYLKLLGRFPTSADKDIPEKFIDKYVKNIFQKRYAYSRNRVIKELERYDGSRGLVKRLPDWNEYELENDYEIISEIPPFNKIDWIGTFTEISDKYLEQKRLTLDLIESTKVKIGKAKENLFIQKKAASFRADNKAELSRFLEAWKKQLNSDIVTCLNNKLWTSLPLFSDYYEYYRQVYVKYYPQDKLIDYIRNYKNSDDFSKVYANKYAVIGINGKKLVFQMKGAIGKVLDTFNNDLEEAGKNCLNSWDVYFNNYEKGITDICDKYLTAITNIINNNILQKWSEYKINNDISGKNSCKNVLEYAIKSGKLPEIYVKFLTGNVPELNGYRNIIRADGSRFSDYWKHYIREKLVILLDKWK